MYETHLQTFLLEIESIIIFIPSLKGSIFYKIIFLEVCFGMILGYVKFMTSKKNHLNWIMA